ncbi:MAG: hypothetical protein IJS27_00830 [Ruminococcus sp.]|nr:hypothetical protein [Ruminococcus sp.]
MLIVLGAAVIYGVYIAPSSSIYLESGESLTITLNSRRRVLSAGRFSELIGQSYEDAVGCITEDMIAKHAVTEKENSLIIGLSGGIVSESDAITGAVVEAFDKNGLDGCVVTVPCEDSDPKTVLCAILSAEDTSMKTAELKRLTVNDLCILLSGSDRQHSDITVTGTPSQSAYIGFDEAVAKALKQSSLREDELTDVSSAYSVYRGRLIYLVRLSAGDTVEAYFINAVSGVTEEAVKAPSTQIDRMVEKLFENEGGASSQTDPTNTQSPVVPTQASTEVLPSISDITPPFVEDSEPTSALPQSIETVVADNTQAPTEWQSDNYRSVDITLMELSFVTLSPPDDAVAVSYQPLFEGQYIEARQGDRINTGTVTVITDRRQLQKLLGEHPYRYTDRNGDPLINSFTDDYFKTRYIIASACTFSDAGYYTTITDLRSDGDRLYMENSLTYGTAQSGENNCQTLSLYELNRSAASPDLNLSVY